MNCNEKENEKHYYTGIMPEKTTYDEPSKNGIAAGGVPDGQNQTCISSKKRKAADPSSHHHKVEKKVRLDTDHTPSPVVKKNLMQDFCGAHKMDDEGPTSCVSFVGGGTATATTPITDPKEESMKLAKGFSNFLSKREGKRVYLRAPMEQFLRTYLHLKKNPSKDAPDSSHDDSASMPSLESPTHVVVEQMMPPRGRMPLKYRPTLKYRATPKHRVTEPAVVETVHLSDDDDGSVQPE